MNGLLLALQFFTVIPIRKELPLGRKEVTAMYAALPFVGAAIGLLMYIAGFLSAEFFGAGPLLTAVLIALASIVLTGGLHLDGWADAGDAFFSYRERERRLDILADPRLGAFGTMALLLIIILKIALFHEVLLRGQGSVALFMGIPFLARATMNLYFTTTVPAKNEGLAYFFKEKLQPKNVVGMSVVGILLCLFAIGYLLESLWIPLVFTGVLGLAILLYRNWSLKHFGGVTGDLAGAFVEGMEAVLWLGVLVLL